MGVLSSFERRLSGLVEGTFAKVFKGWAEPAQIAGALTRELDSRRVTGARQTLVPNSFVVDLSGRDHERLVPYSESLSDELATMLREHADEERYNFAGPVTVHLARDASLSTGVFRIHAEVNNDGTIEAAPEPAGREPHRDVEVAGAPKSYARPAPAPVVAPLPVAAVPPARPAAEPLMPPAAEPLVRPATETVVARDWKPEATLPARHTGASLTVTYAGGDLEAANRSFPLTAAVTRIGRAHDVDLRVDDTAVSRNHAEVRRLPEGRGHLLVDLGSTNGTSVNGRKVATWELREGDRIQVGTATLAYNPEPESPADSYGDQG